MIKLSQVLRLLADTVLADAGVSAICDKFSKPQRIYIGHAAEEALQPADSCVRISFVAGDEYEMGRPGGEREIPVKVTVDLTTQDTEQRGRVAEFIGPTRLDELCAAIVEAIYAIENFGDELTGAKVTSETSQTWPVCRATIELLFKCGRGTAFEPEIV